MASDPTIKAALEAGSVRVPRMLTDDMRLAVWLAQIRHDNNVRGHGVSDEVIRAKANAYVSDKHQRGVDIAAWAAMIAAAERSAHADRREVETLVKAPMVEVSPGVWRIAAIVDAERREALIRRAWLRVIQAENTCAVTGSPCHAKRCGCAAEQEMLIEEAARDE
jgi:hypothetical protein